MNWQAAGIALLFAVDVALFANRIGLSPVG